MWWDDAFKYFFAKFLIFTSIWFKVQFFPLKIVVILHSPLVLNTSFQRSKRFSIDQGEFIWNSLKTSNFDFWFEYFRQLSKRWLLFVGTCQFFKRKITDSWGLRLPRWDFCHNLGFCESGTKFSIRGRKFRWATTIEPDVMTFWSFANAGQFR